VDTQGVMLKESVALLIKVIVQGVELDCKIKKLMLFTVLKLASQWIIVLSIVVKQGCKA
jgi:hypothetical protein